MEIVGPDFFMICDMACYCLWAFARLSLRFALFSPIFRSKARISFDGGFGHVRAICCRADNVSVGYKRNGSGLNKSQAIRQNNTTEFQP